MNFIPIILVLALLFGGEKITQIKDFLSKIDFASFAPILTTLGVKKEFVDYLSSEEFSETLSGDFDLKKLIPLLTSLFSSTHTDDKDKSQSQSDTDYVKPIKDVAPSDVEDSINSFFS